MKPRGWGLIWVVVGLWLVALMVLGVVAVGAVATFGGGGDFEERTLSGEGDQKVVVIHIAGEISGGTDEGGARDVIAQLRQAEEDPDAAAIVLRLDTPGGAVVASDEIYREVRRLGEDMPIVASMGDVAASGGYYIAAAAEKIVANPATLTGSIGVIAVLPNLEGTAEKLGVKPVVLKTGAFKDAGSPFREMRPEDRAIFERLLGEAYDQFVGAVAEGRGMKAEEIRTLADGRVYSGRQAKDLGLIDMFGDLRTAYRQALELAELDEEASRLVELRRRSDFGDFFPPFIRSPLGEVKEELGLDFGLKYLLLP